METALEPATLVLECIDGKDDHFKIDVQPNQTIVLSAADGENTIIVKELQGHDAIVFTNVNGKLLVDAATCAVPVKINGNIVIRNELRTHDVLRIGNSI
jgi:hypothetical protein